MASVDLAILSCTLEEVFNRLASPILKEFQARHGAKGDLKKLGSKLSKIQGVLSDADQKQMTNALVKEWLVDVRDLVYEAEDILDLCATYVGLLNLVCNSPNTSSKSTSVTNMKRDEIEPCLKEIVQKSEELVIWMDDLDLKANVVGRPTMEIVRRERETSSLVDEALVYGRESDKNMIVDLLLSDEPSGGDVVGVLPIIGMGGLGKTTLAQLVYNDVRVMEHFDIRGWVCVSEEVDLRRLTQDIVDSVTKRACNLVNLDLLQNKLKDELNGKRFLIVLDDIWNENRNNLEALLVPFRSGKQGSKIVVTTRSKVVSKIMGTISTHSLGVLKTEDCSSLFWQRAAVDEKYLSAHPNLKAIGEKIVEKCKGLPLAARTLGSLLQFKSDEDEWEAILKADIWDLPEDENIILPILRLSYQNLPSRLKQCFVYCSIFPKDYLFKKEDLVWLWMAESFLQSSKGKQMEDIGSSYFDDLVSRSFLQYSWQWKGIGYVMHDLVHDLAQSILRETCIALEGDKLCNINTSEKARYSSLVFVRNQPVGFDAFYDAKHLRTFLLRFPGSSLGGYAIQKIAHDLFPAWRCLRVLSLRNLPISKLPDSIGNLRLLRYLDLNGTYISLLPESACNLYNLQTLILGHYITELPKGLNSLINIRHIRMQSLWLKKMPRGIGKLTSLQSLNCFGVDKSDGSARLGELKYLIHLTGGLQVSGLENVVDVTDAEEANLKNKQHLSMLTLVWSVNGKDAVLAEEKRVMAEELIECLQPHKNLKVLCIRCFPGMRFPSWMATSSGLVTLTLRSSKEIQVLPQLGGLPFLKKLYIGDFENVKLVGGCEFYGDGVVKGFPSLESLTFYDMPEWEEWFSMEEGQEEKEADELFPRLATLSIIQCPKLTGLPFYSLPLLDYLFITECEALTTLSRLRIPSHVGDEGEEFPYLRTLQIYNCPKLMQLPHLLPSLQRLTIYSCRQLGVLPRLPMLHYLQLHGCGGKRLFTRVGPLPLLSELDIFDIRRLKRLTEEFLQSITALTNLRISNCKHLKSVGSEVMGLHHLTSLQRVEIHGCRNLSFPKEEEGLPPKLQYLSFRLLNKHEILYQLQNLTSLVELEIRMVPRLASFLEMGLPPKLRILEIGECKSLKSLPKGLHNLTYLEELTIDRCPGLTSFTVTEDEEGGFLSPSLKSLCIEGCGNLKELSRRVWIHHNLTSHGDLTTQGYRTSTALKEISIVKCKNLMSLPSQLQNLTSLEKLSIMRCPQLLTFQEEGDWPIKLRELQIGGCGDYVNRLPKCARLHKLTSLEKLTISWCSGFISFPKEEEEEWKLPPILRELCFDHFKSLEFFRPKWLYSLTSLDTLIISHVRKLTSLPEEGPPTTLRELRFMHLESLEFIPPKWLPNLTSLQILCFYNVTKLASLPEDGLPSMLQCLWIGECPLLQDLCLKEKGRYWPKIAHIPDIDLHYTGR